MKILKREASQIVIPTVVVSEYLANIDDKDKIKTLAELTKRFFVPPFDPQCAYWAAKLVNMHPEPKIKGIPFGRVCLRADIQIVATAKTFGVKRIYSHDNGLRLLANSIGIDAFDLPKFDEYLIEP